MALIQYDPHQNERLWLEALAEALPWSDAVARALQHAMASAGQQPPVRPPQGSGDVGLVDGEALVTRVRHRKAKGGPTSGTRRVDSSRSGGRSSDPEDGDDDRHQEGTDEDGPSGARRSNQGHNHHRDRNYSPQGGEGAAAAAAARAAHALQLALATMGAVPGHVTGLGEGRCSAAAFTLSVAMASAAQGGLPPAVLQLVSPYRSRLERLGQVGKGGFGSVVAVRSRLDKRLMAVKEVSFRSELPPWAPPEHLEQRHAKLLREVQALANLGGSPHVVRYYSAWIEPAWDKLGQQLRRSAAASGALAAGLTQAPMQTAFQALVTAKVAAASAGAAGAGGEGEVLKDGGLGAAVHAGPGHATMSPRSPRSNPALPSRGHGARAPSYSCLIQELSGSDDCGGAAEVTCQSRGAGGAGCSGLYDKTASRQQGDLHRRKVPELFQTLAPPVPSALAAGGALVPYNDPTLAQPPPAQRLEPIVTMPSSSIEPSAELSTCLTTAIAERPSGWAVGGSSAAPWHAFAPVRQAAGDEGASRGPLGLWLETDEAAAVGPVVSLLGAQDGEGQSPWRPPALDRSGSDNGGDVNLCPHLHPHGWRSAQPSAPFPKPPVQSPRHCQQPLISSLSTSPEALRLEGASRGGDSHDMSYLSYQTQGSSAALSSSVESIRVPPGWSTNDIRHLVRHDEGTTRALSQAPRLQPQPRAGEPSTSQPQRSRAGRHSNGGSGGSSTGGIGGIGVCVGRSGCSGRGQNGCAATKGKSCRAVDRDAASTGISGSGSSWTVGYQRNGGSSRVKRRGQPKGARHGDVGATGGSGGRSSSGSGRGAPTTTIDKGSSDGSSHRGGSDVGSSDGSIASGGTGADGSTARGGLHRHARAVNGTGGAPRRQRQQQTRRPPPLSEQCSWTFDRGSNGDGGDGGTHNGSTTSSDNTTSSSGSGSKSYPTPGSGSGSGESSSSQEGTEGADPETRSREYSWTFDRGVGDDGSAMGGGGAGDDAAETGRGAGAAPTVPAGKGLWSGGDGGGGGSGSRRRRRRAASTAGGGDRGGGRMFHMDGVTTSSDRRIAYGSSRNGRSGDGDGDSPSCSESSSSSSSYNGSSSGSDSGGDSSGGSNSNPAGGARGVGCRRKPGKYDGSIILPDLQFPLPAPRHQRRRPRPAPLGGGATEKHQSTGGGGPPSRRPRGQQPQPQPQPGGANGAAPCGLAVLTGIRRWPYTLYISMELVVGPTLTRWLQLRAERLPGLDHPRNGAVERSIFRQIVTGLAYVHAAGIIHRDLKPANVFLVPLLVGEPADGGNRSGGGGGEGGGGSWGAATWSRVPDAGRTEFGVGAAEAYLVKIGDFGLAAEHSDASVIFSSGSALSSATSSSEGPYAATRSVGVGIAAVGAAHAAPAAGPFRRLCSMQAPGAVADNDGDDGAAGVRRQRSISDVVPSAAGAPRSGAASFSASGSRSERTSGIGTASYSAPEQLEGPSGDGGGSGASYYGPEVDIYPLGLILMELFCIHATSMERANAMRQARAGRLPASFLRNHPDEARLAEACLQLRPELRPSAVQLLALLDLLWAPSRVPTDPAVAAAAAAAAAAVPSTAATPAAAVIAAAAVAAKGCDGGAGGAPDGGWGGVVGAPDGGAGGGGAGAWPDGGLSYGDEDVGGIGGILPRALSVPWRRTTPRRLPPGLPAAPPAPPRPRPAASGDPPLRMRFSSGGPSLSRFVAEIAAAGSPPADAVVVTAAAAPAGTGDESDFASPTASQGTYGTSLKPTPQVLEDAATQTDMTWLSSSQPLPLPLPLRPQEGSGTAHVPSVKAAAATGAADATAATTANATQMPYIEVPIGVPPPPRASLYTASMRSQMEAPGEGALGHVVARRTGVVQVSYVSVAPKEGPACVEGAERGATCGVSGEGWADTAVLEERLRAAEAEVRRLRELLAARREEECGDGNGDGGGGGQVPGAAER